MAQVLGTPRHSAHTRERRGWCWLFASICLAPGAAGAQLEGPPTMTVERNVQVSAPRPNLPVRELRVCTNPRDANDLAVIGEAYIPAINGRSVRTYRSHDGGAHWQVALEDTAGVQIGNSNDGQGDPECAYGADGTLYAMYLTDTHLQHDTLTDIAQVHRLPPGHTQWLLTRLPFHDRPFLSVDLTGGPQHGTVYLGDNTATLQSPDLYRSTDGGEHFLGPARSARPDSAAHRQRDTSARSADTLLPPYQYAMPSESVVLLDGTVAIPRMLSRFDKTAYTALPQYRVDVVRATDGGTHFPPPTVLEEEAARPCFILATSIAQDQSDGPYRGRVYVAWAGIRGDHCEILVAHSDDGAKTWSPPVMITQEAFRSDARPGGDHQLPYVAVNCRGIVGVAWYDYRDDPNPARPGYVLRFAASRDGGETFGRSVPVSETHVTALDPFEFGVWTSGGSTGDTMLPGDQSAQLTVRLEEEGGDGDTNGLRADAAGDFHPVWVDNRTGVGQIWTARVRVTGAAIRHGARALAALTDVTGQVGLVVTHVSYNRGARELTADMALRNTSSKVLAAPLMVRVVGITPAMTGTPEVVGADNGERGAGAIWDFSRTLDGILAPQGVSRPRRLTVRLSPAQWGTIRLTRMGGTRGDDPAAALFGSLALRMYGRLSDTTGSPGPGS